LKHAKRPRRRTAFQRTVIVVNAVACLTCIALAAGITWSWQRVREIPRIELGTELASGDVAAGPAGGAQNFLIVGTDSADGLPDDDPVRTGRDAGVRTDTLMLVRLDPASAQASLLSLPRDLYVPISGTRGSSRINNAIQGGPARLVATINDALDVPVHHYVELDFQGFRDLVEAVDGIPVYFDTPVRDRNSGLWVPGAGCVTLSPVQALAYARSRAYEVRDDDGDWRTDPTGDLGRISRQQDFIRRALHRAFQRGARNPAVLADLVGVGTRAITIDGDLTPSDLLELGNRFRSFDPSNLRTFTLPVLDDVVGGAAVLRLDSTAAQPILDIFRGEDPDRVAPDNTVVLVQNGTTTSGRAAEAAAGLRDLDFVVPPDNVGDAASFDIERTTVLYLEGEEERAELVARALAVDPVVEEGDYIVGADVSVLIGADWPGIGEELRDATPGLVPTTSTTTPRSTTTTTPSSTTTSVVGDVPATPAGEAC
jgi:polyisoprenyl-teichoic acid--peptidoglycan teichoic acid transferase